MKVSVTHSQVYLLTLFPPSPTRKKIQPATHQAFYSGQKWNMHCCIKVLSGAPGKGSNVPSTIHASLEISPYMSIATTGPRVRDKLASRGTKKQNEVAKGQESQEQKEDRSSKDSHNFSQSH